MPEDAYTIDIPGAADIFILPLDSLENETLRKQQIARMKSAVSPRPDILDWIPNVITKLDDAQDLLWTALVLAKPLLVRLPERFIPYVGWVLLANDLLNLSTTLLGMVASGRPSKRKVRSAFTSLPFSRTARIGRVAKFLEVTRWIPFALQAGQALESVTGYGLRLGAIMSASNDLMWAGIRKLQGKKVIFRGPPPADPAAKAARYLMQPIAQYVDPNILSDHDTEILIAADNIATQILAENFNWEKMNQREPILYTTETPAFIPWNEASIAALTAEGLNPNTAEITIGERLYPARRRFSHHIFLESKRLYKYELNIRDRFQNERGQYLQNVYDEAGRTIMEKISNNPEVITPTAKNWQIVLVLCVEYNVFPPVDTPNETVLDFCERALEMAWAVGLDWPDQIILQNAATEIMGGWEERPPA